MGSVELVIITVFAGLVLAFVGFILGRSRERQRSREAVEEAERRVRQESWVRAPEPLASKDDRYRMLDLIVNLPETINQMGAARSTQALCRITARAIVDLVGARRVGLFLARGAPPRFRLEVFVGSPRPKKKLEFSIGEGRLGRLAQLIGVRSEGDLTVLPEVSNEADRLFTPEMCVTIRRQEMVHAFVALDGIESNDAMTRRVVQMLSDIHAVSAAGLRSLHKERIRAELDQLTGLFNRRHLDRRLQEEVARAQAYGLDISIFLFDIDNFKHYNDTNGHQAGDECLKWVSSVTRKVTRGSDIVCRYGGEEFLVILLGSSQTDAWHHAERIRTAIASTEFPNGEKQPLGFVSVSGGVSSFPYHADDPDKLVELADRALYYAKEHGRNRVARPSEVSEAFTHEKPTTEESTAKARRRTDRVSQPVVPKGHIESGIVVEDGSVPRAPDPILTPLPGIVQDIEDYAGPVVHTPIPRAKSPHQILERSTKKLDRKGGGVYALGAGQRSDRTRK